MKRKRIFLLVIALMVLLITMADVNTKRHRRLSLRSLHKQTKQFSRKRNRRTISNEKIITWVVAAPAENPADMAAVFCT